MSFQRIKETFDAIEEELEKLSEQFTPLFDRCPNWTDDEPTNFRDSDLSDEEQKLMIDLSKQLGFLQEKLRFPQDHFDFTTVELSAYYRNEEKMGILEQLKAIDSLKSNTNIFFECSVESFRDALKEYLESKTQRFY